MRARGISSYTEQLFSDDDESEEDELDGWADIEAIYATPSTQASTSTPDTPSKAENSGIDTEEEDSDKDWILPSSRKRRSKRSCKLQFILLFYWNNFTINSDKNNFLFFFLFLAATQRLKSFHHKLNSIKTDNDSSTQSTPSKESDVKSVSTLRSRSPTPNKTPSRQPTPVKTPEKIQTPIPPMNNVEIKTEEQPQAQPQDSGLHSVLDIKDEGPIYDGTQQPNLLVVTTGHANYVVMQQQNTSVNAVMQPASFMQPTAFVSPTMIAHPQGYYVHTNQPQNYIVQNPPGLITTAGPRPTFIATTNPQLVYQPNQQPMQYVQYVAAPQPQMTQPMLAQPRIINTMTLTPPRQIAGVRMRAPLPNSNIVNANRIVAQNRAPFPHPNGAVIRSAPLAPNVLRPGQRVAQSRGGARRQVSTFFFARWSS